MQQNSLFLQTIFRLVPLQLWQCLLVQASSTETISGSSVYYRLVWDLVFLSTDPLSIKNVKNHQGIKISKAIFKTS